MVGNAQFRLFQDSNVQQTRVKSISASIFEDSYTLNHCSFIYINKYYLRIIFIDIN